MDHAFAHGYALLVGVGRTAYPDWSLPLTVKDAAALHSILLDPSLCAFPDNAEHVRLLTDAAATADAIIDGLTWLRDAADRDPEATVVVFFAGHGWLERATGRYYLIHYATDPDDILGTALVAEAFADALRQVQAKRLLVIFDCCHAQGMATARGEPAVEMSGLPREIAARPMPEPVMHALKHGEGRAVMTSSRGTQRSWEWSSKAHGIFTYHLLEALQGAANLPGDDVVRLSNLQNYLGRTVPETARDLCRAEQVPFFDLASEDFPIALLRGGRGLPAGGWEAIRHEARYDPLPPVQIRSMSGGSVQLGDRTVEQHGTYNLDAETISGTASGEGAKIVHGDDQSGADNRRGAFVSGGTIHGTVVGINTGTITTSYGATHSDAGSPLAQALAAVEQAAATAQGSDDDLGADLQAIAQLLRAAWKAEREHKPERRAAKIDDARQALGVLARADGRLEPLSRLLERIP